MDSLGKRPYDDDDDDDNSNNNNNNNNNNSVVLTRERTIPTEQPPLAGKISTKFLQIEGCCVVSAADPLQP
jgi:hypothetical protein